jgi:hypothetical protein
VGTALADDAGATLGRPRATCAAVQTAVLTHDAGRGHERRSAARAGLVDGKLVPQIQALHANAWQQTACRKTPPISEERSTSAGGAVLRAHENGRPRTLTPREAADLAGELDEEDFEARIESVCFKWVADEAATLSEASLMLRDYAEWLLELELDGWQLVDPVDGGHGLLVNEDPEKRLSGPASERRQDFP